MGLFLSELKRNSTKMMIVSVLLMAATLVSAAPEPYSYHAQRLGRHYFESYLPGGGYPWGYSSSPLRRSFTSFRNGLIRPFNYKAGLARSDDIIKQTRILSDSVQQTLRELAASPSSAVIVDKIISDKDNVCLKDLDDALAYIETATSLVEAAGDDIKALVSEVKVLGKLKEPATVARKVAEILEILEPLVKNIAPANPEVCQATPAEAFGSLRSLSLLVAELAEDRALYKLGVSEAGRAELRQSAATISAVTTFLTQLREDFTRFQEICTGDKQYNLDAITAIGDMVVHLADMVGSLGAVQVGEDLRKGKLYAERIVAELSKIDPQDLGTLDCSTPGDFSTATATLRDLATIIDDVGIDNLQEQLGINLGFVFV